jgi:hypothetical protein
LASSDPDKKEFLSATKEVIDAIKLWDTNNRVSYVSGNITE